MGESLTSEIRKGSFIPPILVVPDQPTSLIHESSTKTEVTFYWTAPASDGGSAIIDYTIEMFDTTQLEVFEVA